MNLWEALQGPRHQADSKEAQLHLTIHRARTYHYFPASLASLPRELPQPRQWLKDHYGPTEGERIFAEIWKDETAWQNYKAGVIEKVVGMFSDLRMEIMGL